MSIDGRATLRALDGQFQYYSLEAAEALGLAGVSRLPCSWREAVDHFLRELDFIPADELPWVMGRALSQLLGWKEPATA